MAQAGSQVVVEEGLADGDEKRAAEGAGEEHERDAGGDVCFGEDGLRGETALLHAGAEAEAEDDLVADPFGGGGIGSEGGDQAGSDRDEDGAEKHPRVVPSCRGDDGAGRKGAED